MRTKNEFKMKKKYYFDFYGCDIISILKPCFCAKKAYLFL